MFYNNQGQRFYKILNVDFRLLCITGFELV